jgi:hypothetical protein
LVPDQVGFFFLAPAAARDSGNALMFQVFLMTQSL